MTFIILTRNPSTQRLAVVRAYSDDNDVDPPIAEYPTSEEAERVAESMPACAAWGFEVVEIKARVGEVA